MRTSRWPISHLPISDITPFTYRDGETYLELLNRLSQYITEQLHPNLRNTVEHMVEEMEHILAAQHGKYVEGIQEFQRIHDAFMTDVNSALMALNDNAVSDLADDPGTVFGQKLRELFIQASSEDVRPSGDWTFTKGYTTNQDRQRLSVERDFAVSRGDLYDSRTRLEFSIRNQEATTQNPPGYSSASIDLVDEGSDIAEQYRGENTRLLILSNRFIFNKRIEVDMGGDTRAVIRSGNAPNQEIADLGILNNTYPRLTVNGYNSTGSHGGSRAGFIVVDRAQFRIISNHSNGFEMENTDTNDVPQLIRLRQMGAGHQALTFYHDDENVGEVSGHPNGDMYLGSNATNRVFVRGDLVPQNRIILQSSNGSRFFLRVSDSGALTAVGI